MISPIEYLESRIAPAAIISATSNNELLTFDSETPGTVETIAITGLLGTAGETLVGVDFRPATGGLYAFTVNDASQGQLYLIDPITAEATPVGTAITDMNLTLSKTAGYGFDFNPTVDRIRIVNSNGENFRVNPNNGALAGVDTDLTAGSVVHGSAYDRNFAGSTTTTLFGIDVNADQLVLQGSVNGTPSSPNGGLITSVGALGVNAVSASFDIANGTGIGFAVLQVGSTTGLYTVNLTTGAVTSVGDVGTGTSTIVGMAVATEQIQIVNSKTAKYTDVDGDVVTIKITKGELTPGMFELGAGPNGGAYLRLLNLTDPSFSGTNLTITAKPGPDGGDKLASVSYINATGVDLGNVKISGDLTQIDAGDTAGGIGVKSLSVDSFGRISATNPATDLVSSIEGSLNKLSVKKDFAANAQLSVTDSTEGALGRIGSITIGGSMVGGSIASGASISAEQIGNAKIAGDLKGGVNGSGAISVSNRIDSVTINGSLLGGTGLNAGAISSSGEIGKVTIKGSIVGGGGEGSARINATGGDITSITVNGSLIGGGDDGAGSIAAEGTIGNVTIKGSMIGGAGGTATILTGGDITKISVGGSVLGNDGNSAVIGAANIQSVKIGGDLSVINPSAENELAARIFAENELGSVSIAGSVTGSHQGNGTIQGTTIGSVTINGSLTGGPEQSGSIIASTSINKVTIGGNMVGEAFGSGSIQVNAGSLGSVSVKGSIQGGSISATTTIDKVVVTGDVSASSANESAISAGGAIGTITIKGSLHAGSGTGNILGLSIDSVTVGDQVVGSIIQSNEGELGSVKIQGSLEDSTLRSATSIGKISIGKDVIGSAIFSEDAIDSIVINGSVHATNDDDVRILAGVLNSVKVNGDIVGTSLRRVVIAASGTDATSGTTDVAIAKITIGGRVENADILAGYDNSISPVNADAQIGKISVGSDWITSNLVAGIFSEDAVFGNGDDVIIGEVGQVPGIVASIAGITIKGTVVGTFGGNDGFAFTAEEIKAVSIAGKKVQLETGPSNDNLDGLDPLFVFGNTQDVRIREVGIV